MAVVESTASSNRLAGVVVAPGRLKSLVIKNAVPKSRSDAFEVRVGTVAHGRGSKGDRVRAQALKRAQPFSISEIEEACPGVSRATVRLVLRAMKAQGLIASTGKGRSAKWIHLAAGGVNKERQHA